MTQDKIRKAKNFLLEAMIDFAGADFPAMYPKLQRCLQELNALEDAPTPDEYEDHAKRSGRAGWTLQRGFRRWQDASPGGWIRFRFDTTEEDYRPVKVPPPGPWWCSGQTWRNRKDTNILIAYAHSREEILEFWPDTIWFDDETPSPEGPKFSERFPCPEDWDEKKQEWKVEKQCLKS